MIQARRFQTSGARIGVRLFLNKGVVFRDNPNSQTFRKDERAKWISKLGF